MGGARMNFESPALARVSGQKSLEMRAKWRSTNFSQRNSGANLDSAI